MINDIVDIIHFIHDIVLWYPWMLYKNQKEVSNNWCTVCPMMYCQYNVLQENRLKLWDCINTKVLILDNHLINDDLIWMKLS